MERLTLSDIARRITDRIAKHLEGEDLVLRDEAPIREIVADEVAKVFRMAEDTLRHELSRLRVVDD
jgi:hypothetical protein